MLLALDTSASASAALLVRGRVVACAAVHEPRRHAEVLLPLVQRVLAEAGAGRGDVTAVAVGVGPGPFTGLRVGMVSALTTGLALGLPVHGVCSLDALALHAVAALAGSGHEVPAELGVATDARRREVYWATYRTGGTVCGAEGLIRQQGPAVSAPADVGVRAHRWVGRGTRLYPEHLDVTAGADVDDLLDPPASGVALVADAALAGRGSLPLLPVEPLYLRRPDAVPAPGGGGGAGRAGAQAPAPAPTAS